MSIQLEGTVGELVRRVSLLEDQASREATFEVPVTVNIPHQFLDNPIHTDTATNAPLQGAVVGGDATPEWARIVHPGGANRVFQTTAAGLQWSAQDLILTADLTNLGGAANQVAYWSANNTLNGENQLSLARGGTGANLSATGGANEFVQQAGVGAAFTVGPIAAASLPAHTHAGAGQGGPLVVGTTNTGAVAGSIIFAGVAGVQQQDNANLFWDDGNNRLGVGTAVPGYEIHNLHTQDAQTVTATENASNTANAGATLAVASATSTGTFGAFPANYAGSGPFFIDRVLLAAGVDAAGLDILAHAGAGDISFYTGGVSLRLIIDATGLATFYQGWILSGSDGDLDANNLIIDGDGDTSLAANGDDIVRLTLATASGEFQININGVDDFTFTEDSFNVASGSYITMADDTWTGLPGPGGRLIFDSTPAPDQIQIADADLYFNTGLGIIHADGVVAGMVLVADGTRYIPAVAAATLPIAPAAVGDTLIATAGPLWNILTTPGAAGYARVSTATTEVWDQTPTWTGDHTWESAVSAHPALTIENTNADAQAPVIEFYKNSASPAASDDLGAFDFYGETNTGAKDRYAYWLAESLDVTNGATGGGMRFMVTMNGVDRFLLSLLGFNGVADQGEVIINEGGQDVDFIVETDTMVDALVVQGSDGEITLGALGAGFVQSTVGGVLSSAAIIAGDLPAHTHAGAATGGSLVIGTTDTDATAGSVFFAGGAGVIQQDNAGLFYDNTNDTLGIRSNAPHAVAEGLHVPWIAGDVRVTSFFGSTAIGMNKSAVYGATDSGIGIEGWARSGWGIYGQSSSGIGVDAHSITGTVLRVNLSGAGAAIADFQDNAVSILTIQDGGQADFAEYLRHLGDTDTYLRFQADNITLRAGGVDMIDAVEAATDYVNFPAGLVFLNRTSNANMTQGITIDQGANNDEAFAVASSEVTHGMTTLAETDVYGTITKSSAGDGGISIAGYTETLIAARIVGYITNDSTGTSATAATGVRIRVAKKSGTTFGDVAAGQNLWGVQSRTGGAWRNAAIFKQDGDLYLDTVVNENAWDDHDDGALLHGLRASLAPTGSELRKRFGQWIEYAKPVLERTGVVEYNDDGHHYVAVKQLQMLTIDAVRQLYEKCQRYEQALLNAGLLPQEV